MFHTIAAETLDRAAAYRMITGCVAPRPIAWITTRSPGGVVNIAPFSSYNYVASAPPMVAVNISAREGELKDTARNIVETREFVVNVPDESALDLVHLTSAEHPAEESEAEAHAIALTPSRFVRPPRIEDTPIQLECAFEQSITLGEGFNTLYIGKVIAFHLSEAIFDGRYIDIARFKPLARLSGPHYAGLGEIVRRDPPFIPPGMARRTPSS